MIWWITEKSRQGWIVIQLVFGARWLLMYSKFLKDLLVSSQTGSDFWVRSFENVNRAVGAANRNVLSVRREHCPRVVTTHFETIGTVIKQALVTHSSQSCYSSHNLKENELGFISTARWEMSLTRVEAQNFAHLLYRLENKLAEFKLIHETNLILTLNKRNLPWK